MVSLPSSELIRKYAVPGPRYTSYPTVPFWENDLSPEAWQEAVGQRFQQANAKGGISLYIHLPYCEQLCTYCGCNKYITRNHAVELPYIQSLLQEWMLYHRCFDTVPRISELHLGGGTPTFFQPHHLTLLIDGIGRYAYIDEKAHMSFEAHPSSTTRQHLRQLYALGFRRLSLGIQDFDQEVQRLIHRRQTYEQVEQVVEWARALGYESINFDLVYGLPGQTPETVQHTIRLVEQLRPDRIAWYGYAHVPWLVPAQRSLEEWLPNAEQRLQLYEQGKQWLLQAGYFDIGMDHFALPHDALYQAYIGRRLHRNFMGYTAVRTELLLALGASAISDAWYAFAQNEKQIAQYQQRVHRGELPIARGHRLNEEDLRLRKHILQLMCHYETHLQDGELPPASVKSILQALGSLQSDGLLNLYRSATGWHIALSSQGRPFVRNVCMAFDLRLRRQRHQQKQPLFSSTV